MILTESEVRTYFYNAGFRGAALDAAVQIAFCESSFDTNAYNKDGEDSLGLMQINVLAHPEYVFYDLFDPQINANVAFELYTKANNSFKDWTCAYTLGLVNPENSVNNNKILLAFSLALLLYLIS